MAPTSTKRLLTGPPGIGKTTAILRVLDLLPRAAVAGFHTAEIREGGARVGFRIETVGGDSAVLAHVSFRGPRRVGRYGVDVEALEELALPELARDADLYLIDEIGKMECFSEAFIARVRNLLETPRPLIATVALKGGGFIAEVKARGDVDVLRLTSGNRDGAPVRLAAELRDLISGASEGWS